MNKAKLKIHHEPFGKTKRFFKPIAPLTYAYVFHREPRVHGAHGHLHKTIGFFKVSWIYLPYEFQNMLVKVQCFGHKPHFWREK